MADDHKYNPLDKDTYKAIAYNAVGRASEIGTYPGYALIHSTGNSGWSVGAVQWDFGQPGRGGKADEMLDGYRAWASPENMFSEQEFTSLATRLKIKGQVGNALTDEERSRLGDYLLSDPGRSLVDGINQEQIEKKLIKVGEPLSKIEWLQKLAADDPAQAAEIVAMTSKLYNQNENKGGQLLKHLQDGELTSDQTQAWIGDQGIDGLSQSARTAIVSGRDNALAGIRLFNSLEMDDGKLGQAWREEIHTNGNIGLTSNFNYNSNAQLFDAMMRNPSAGAQILNHFVGGEAPNRPIVITGINDAARQEMGRVELSRDGTLNLRDTRNVEYNMTKEGWQLANPPEVRRQMDTPDHTGPGMRMPSASIRQGGPNDPNHPDHAMLEQIRAGVRKIDEGLGKPYDDMSERISRGLLAACKDNREMYSDKSDYSLTGNALNRVDHVILGKNGNIFAVQGNPNDPGDPANKRAHAPVEQLVRTPVEQSDEKLQVANQTLTQERTLAQQQELARGQNEPTRNSPVMS